MVAVTAAGLIAAGQGTAHAQPDRVQPAPPTRSATDPSGRSRDVPSAGSTSRCTRPRTAPSRTWSGSRATLSVSPPSAWSTARSRGTTSTPALPARTTGHCPAGMDRERVPCVISTPGRDASRSLSPRRHHTCRAVASSRHPERESSREMRSYGRSSARSCFPTKLRKRGITWSGFAHSRSCPTPG